MQKILVTKTLTALALGIAISATGIVSCQNTASENDNSKIFEDAIASGKTLAKVGNFEIHEGYLELISRINPQLKAQLDSPAGKKKLLDTISEQELLYQASKKKNLENDLSVQQKMGLYARVIIAQAFVEKELSDRVKAYYDEHKTDEFEQVQIAHIYIKTNAPDTKEEHNKPADDKATPAPVTDDAKNAAKTRIADIKDKLNKGGDFTALAQEFSDDNMSKKKGGDLGFVSRNDKRLLRKDWKAVIDQAFAMKLGDVSDIIETKEGFHIIKLVSGPKLAAFEEVENGIRLKVGATVKKDVVETLKKEHKIEFLEEAKPTQEVVKPEAAAAPAATTTTEANPSPEAAPVPTRPAPQHDVDNQVH